MESAARAALSRALDRGPGLQRGHVDAKRWSGMANDHAVAWMEHMRQHARGTLADQDIFEHARTFQIGDGTPAVRHQIAADTIRKR